MKINWIKEKENLEKLICKKVSYLEIGRRYGISGNAVKKAAIKLGLKLTPRRAINPKEHFNKGRKRVEDEFCLNCGKKIKHNNSSYNKYCSNKCQSYHKYKEYISKWKNGEENGMRGEYGLSKHIKRYLLEKSNHKCEKCGWGETNQFTNTIPLEIHHIDGDYTNNKEENLQVLCPNCHSLTETHKSHNKKVL